MRAPVSAGAPAPGSARAVRGSEAVPGLRSESGAGDSEPALPSAATVAVPVPVPVPVGALAPVDVGGGGGAVPGSAVRVSPAASVEVSVPRAGAVSLPGWSSGVAALPVSVPKLVVPPVLDQVNTSVDVFLHRVANWLAGLPGNNVTTFLEGALLMVRRTLFNQAPNVSPIQQTTTSEGPILGSLGAVDPDADALIYSVVGAPQWGAVEVTAEGDYLYTPGPGYAGSDSFVVNVATAQQGFNIVTCGDGSREVTVPVGDDAASNPFMAGLPDPIDASLYLAQATATITVDRQGGLLGDRFVATVALDGITADTPLTWMDAVGRSGEVSVGQLLAGSGADGASWWDEFAEAGGYSNDGVMLGVDFLDEQGVETTVILANVSAALDAAGQYIFTGRLAANPDEQPDIDQWDVLGSSFKDNYENFLATYLSADQSGPVSVQVVGADLFASTYSPVTYANILVGTDQGYSAEDLGIGTPQSAASGISQGTVASPAPTAVINYADKFAMGFADGAVWQWTDNGWKVLQNNTAWGSAVAKMIDYGDGLVVGLKNGSVQQWTGSAWQELQGTGWGSNIDAMVAYGDGLAVGLNNGSVQQWTGTEWKELHPWQTLTGESFPQFADKSTTNGFDIKNDTSTPLLITGMPEDVRAFKGPEEFIDKGTVLAPGQSLHLELTRGYFTGYDNKTTWAVRSWSGGPDTGAGSWDVTLYSGGLTQIHSAECAGSCYVKDDVIHLTTGRPAIGDQQYIQTMAGYQDGFVVGLADGSVQQWTGTEWKQLKDSGWRSEVRAVLPVGDGLVVGLANGSVQQWAGGEWQQLQDSGWGQPVNGLVAYKDGFVVGLGTFGSVFPFYRPDNPGAVKYWTGSQWQELQGTGWKSPVSSMVVSEDGSTVTVGLGNGSVQQWDGSRWNELQCGYCSTEWNSQVRVMLPDGFKADDGDQVVVGLADGRVEKWVPVTLVDGTRTGNWQELTPKEVDLLTEDALRRAVEYAFSGGDPLAAGAPIFSLKEFRPACGNSCDGSFYPFLLTSDDPYQLASKSFNLGAGGQTLDLSYDVEHAVYGYAYVPAGVWGKLKLSKYSGGFLLALPTGPSVTVNLAGSTKFTSGDISLVSKEYFKPTPYGVFSLNADVTARLDATLALPDDFTEDALSAHAYFVPGFLVTFNTNAFQGLQFGFDWYKDIDFSDFTSIQGVTIVPTLTPSVTGSYGLFTPENTPIIGKKTIASVNLGYENPVSLDLTLAKGVDPSLTFNSTGTLTYGAGILQVLTDSLSFSDELEIYSYTSPNLWTEYLV